ncbi:OLC1v1035155C1 [Oldenlandia corymbosa var. corymbosa]|uniref:Auxin-responsive protein n=1 Tax=Oldenlandia corymbosa var. corymbosa TaxID=529605 RepID=A0AAV1CS90_OLDCO|nr:OLC1v1035155C1 [Oldenlandia corymbosa var. corymbosa]
MSNLDSQRQPQQQQQHQDSLKLRWQETQKKTNNLYTKLLSGTTTTTTTTTTRKMQIFPGGFDDDLVVSTVVPPVTVVLEGRSICQRISLEKHTSYQSLAKALRQMFVDVNNDGDGNEPVTSSDGSDQLDLSNAIPGHLIAYEDMENDLLLVGDLKWNDFVRVAKRIRILPIKANSRKRRVEI